MHIFTVCRIALEFLDSKAFSRDYSRHLKGEPAVKKRHLEMLGYRVVQVSSKQYFDRSGLYQQCKMIHFPHNGFRDRFIIKSTCWDRAISVFRGEILSSCQNGIRASQNSERW